MKLNAIKGVKDILPPDIHLWHHLIDTAKDLFTSFGYEEILIPIIEKTELFKKGIGDMTDIVEKEMYSFVDQGGDTITLRPEGTASAVRAYVEHQMYNTRPVNKLYYFGPMFRRERPQKGRYRQFYQLGVEVFGADKPAVDAEVIYMLSLYLERLGLSVSVGLNSLGCKECRPKFLNILKAYIAESISVRCPDCVRRYENNPLRTMDCKVDRCSEINSSAPSLIDSVCEGCKSHHDSLLSLLSGAGVKFSINDKLVRGLDYYTKTAFEVVSEGLGAQNAVAGGGRYDDLVELFGGPRTPAIGFAIGIERLVSLLNPETLLKGGVPHGFLVISGDSGVQEKGFQISCMLRKEGIALHRSYEETDSIKSQMRKASRYNARYAVILGTNECLSDSVAIKDMITGEQAAVGIYDAVIYIKERFYTA